MWLGVACMTLAGALVAMLVRGGDAARRRRMLRATPHYAIADLPDATLGVVIGVAHPIGSRTLDAPLSGRTCLYYFLRILRSGDDGKKTLAEESRGVELDLEDATGRAILDPRDAVSALRVATTRHYYVSQLDASLLALLRRAGAIVTPHTHVIVEESRIEPGDRIAVIGRGAREDGRLHLASQPHAPLVLSSETRTRRVTLPPARVV